MEVCLFCEGYIFCGFEIVGLLMILVMFLWLFLKYKIYVIDFLFFSFRNVRIIKLLFMIIV